MLSFDDVMKIKDLVNYPWSRKKEVQEAYDKIEDKNAHILRSMISSKELRPNEYPYDLADDCLHLVLWSKKDLPQKAVMKYLHKKLGPRNFVAWTNILKNKSVNQVFHVHVICQVPYAK